MILEVINIIVMFIEAISGKMLLDIFSEKQERAGYKRFIIILFSLVTIYFIVASFFQEQYFIKIPIVALSGIILWNFYYKDSIFKIAIIHLLFIATGFLLDYFTLICISKIKPQISELMENSAAYGILVTVLCKISNIVVILLLWKLFKKKNMRQINQKGWLVTFVFSIFTIVITVILAANWASVQNETQANVLLSISIGLVIMNIFMFYVIHNILETEAANREKDIFRERLTKEIETYQTMEENAATQRALIHEFRNILSMISASNNLDADALVELAKQESQKLEEAADTVNTRNVIVNMVLNTKLKEIRKKDIGILMEIGDLSDLKMEHEDIVIILSNLLNNAIEACEQCKNKKMIWIKCVNERTEVFFSVRNTYDIEPVVQNGKYLTTKTENREMHGMGIGNIIRTVDKYQGAYAIQTEDHEFTFSITIPA